MTFNRFCWYSLAVATALFFFGFCPPECRATGELAPGVDANGVEWVAVTQCDRFGNCLQVVVPRQAAAKPMPKGPLVQTAEPPAFVRRTPLRTLAHGLFCGAVHVAQRVECAVYRAGRFVLFRRCR